MCVCVCGQGVSCNINSFLGQQSVSSNLTYIVSLLPFFGQNFLDVAIELEKMDSVSPERVDFIEDGLRNIGRVDLAKKVAAYKKSGGKL